MTYDSSRALPTDIRSFNDIRQNGYVYVDKTEYIYRLVNDRKKYHYLSRPKRFGKSMLIDTLQCYFMGRGDLFHGLKIERLMTGSEWKSWPVLRLDMSCCLRGVERYTTYVNSVFNRFEQKYGLPSTAGGGIDDRLQSLLDQAADGERIVLLIDEYDAPLLEHYGRQLKGRPNELEGFVEAYRDLFMNIKNGEEGLKFVMLTGCTRFNNLHLFSALNNIRNISFEREFNAICGFTEGEIMETFGPELERMAELRGESVELVMAALRQRFDGYRFGVQDGTERLYNPFSLTNSLAFCVECKEAALLLGYFWMHPSSVGTLNDMGVDLQRMLASGKGFSIGLDEMMMGDITSGNKELLMYQAGILTLDHMTGETCVLRIPNEEVRCVTMKVVLPQLLQMNGEAFNVEWHSWEKGLREDDLEEALWHMRILLALSPHGPEEYSGAAPEQRVALLFTYICYASRCVVTEEPKQAYGEPDRIVRTPTTIYVVEFKRHKEGGVPKAWEQMTDKRYVEPYLGEANLYGQSKRVVALAIGVRDDGRGIYDWQALPYTTDSRTLEVGAELRAAPRWAQAEDALQKAPGKGAKGDGKKGRSKRRKR